MHGWQPCSVKKKIFLRNPKKWKPNEKSGRSCKEGHVSRRAVSPIIMNGTRWLFFFNFDHPPHLPAPKSAETGWILIYLASRNLERRIMTASHVLCFSCIWMDENFLWIICTMRSISLGVMGRVRDCSRSRFITCVVNSLHACNKTIASYRTHSVHRLLTDESHGQEETKTKRRVENRWI